MDLCEVFDAVVPSTVAIISKYVPLNGTAEPPFAPSIIGTGFLVTDSGIAATNRHVAKELDSLPKNPRTGEDGFAALLFQTGKDDDGTPYIRWMLADVASVGMLNSFTSTGRWFGEDAPDIAFLQLKCRNTPYLKLATNEFYIRPGRRIATAGFPMGNAPLVVMKKLNQLTPFIRQGIVSSVFPFSVPRPDGFTIDVMQQGGSSGSPIFYDDDPTVVGMMASGMIDQKPVRIGNAVVWLPFSTNISIAVSAHMIRFALEDFKKSDFAVDTSEFPDFEVWKEEHDASASENLEWERFDNVPLP